MLSKLHGVDLCVPSCLLNESEYSSHKECTCRTVYIFQ
jgi:hypothetical protein